MRIISDHIYIESGYGDGDLLDVEELAAGSTEDIAVDIYCWGDIDVVAAV